MTVSAGKWNGLPPGGRWVPAGLVLLVAGSVAAVAVEEVAAAGGGRGLLAGLPLAALVAVLTLVQCEPPPRRVPYGWRMVLLAVQAVLTYVLVVSLPGSWLGLTGVLAGAVLCALPLPSAVPLAVAVVCGGPLLVAAGWVAPPPGGGVAAALRAVVTACAVCTVARLAMVVAWAHGAREQAARLAEQRERQRMRQDLHDLVGSSLAAIAVQAESVLRAGAPGGSGGADGAGAGAAAGAGAGAGAEDLRVALASAVGLARRAHEDVRALCDPRPGGLPAPDGLSLVDEVRQAGRLLGLAGIAVRVVAPDRVEADPAVVECLRAVVRESVANVLQHSRAARCAISLEALPAGLRLSVRNDGVPSPLPGGAGARRGTGLVGLRARVGALGGVLGVAARGGAFTVSVALPCGAPDGVPGEARAEKPGEAPAGEPGEVGGVGAEVTLSE
ncbi:sensor histidine kinase [Streptomyces fradiae]|uniref:sensor histidine kinase n=1 Tax=Streptomyces fradiae TaxID=1906 RepID=UPI00294288EC|nr:histidine kinase [Streptomyces fradiae]WOI62363.1 histidine kinase [Streptomyces fradiae]